MNPSDIDDSEFDELEDTNYRGKEKPISALGDPLNFHCTDLVDWSYYDDCFEE